MRVLERSRTRRDVGAPPGRVVGVGAGRRRVSRRVEYRFPPRPARSGVPPTCPNAVCLSHFDGEDGP
ncbi:hypothetical protein ACFPM0_12910 [Pseudonocardia sulfidoxydans]|uniref:hypothetical protein n=1 Tax=Pseudonocardia sulfidoxydans TaxID=54011 RepID=UPI00360AC00A